MIVLFLDIVHPILKERLVKSGIQCIDATVKSKEDVIENFHHVDGIVIRSRFKMDSDLLTHFNNLKFIARSGAGMENIDIDYCQSHKIELFNAPEGNRNAVAEHALGMLLALFNRLHLSDKEVRNYKWDREGNRGIELDGKTVGIIGYGNNGKAFAKKLRGFDVEILAHDKYISDFGNEFVIEASLIDIFKQADVISFHIPQNDETVYYANDDFFDLIEKNIYLINLARGKVVKSSALVKAMKNGKVLGACLDVLEYEKGSFESFYEQELPSDFNYLLNSENVIFSPHVGGWTIESYFKLSDVLADKILNWMKRI